MDNEKLTEKVIELIAITREIKAQTSQISEMDKKFDDICLKVHDNTNFRIKWEPVEDDIKKNIEFRKSFEKIKWFSISAIVVSFVAFLFSIFLNKG